MPFSWFARRRRPRVRAIAEPIERRILHSADLIAAAAPLLAPPSPDAAVVRSVDASAPTAAQAVDARRIALVVVDPSARDAQAAVDAIAAQRPDVTLRVVQLDAARDGLAQVGELLASTEGVAALHLVAGGEAGSAILGTTRLDGTTIAARAGELAGWAGSFAADGTLRLDGAATAGSSGALLAAALERATGLDTFASASPQAVSSGGEWVFVDGSVEGADAILADLRANRADLHVVTLDPTRSGLEQILAALDGVADVDAIHLITHGADGLLQVGSDRVTLDALAATRDAWTRLGAHLSADADLLLYGCDVAADARGAALVDAIASLTGADVAASDDLTGSSGLGGDWTLERQVGDVRTAVAVSAALQARWQGVLATFTVTTTADSGAGSLRQAIIDANLSAGADTIRFDLPTAGPHVIQLTSALDPITDAVTIDGTPLNPALAPANGGPFVVLDGGGTVQNGLVLATGADGSTVRGLSIRGFATNGLWITGSGSHLVVGNWFGLDSAGTSVVENGTGIRVANAAGVTIGGTAVADRNVISGSAGDGVRAEAGATGLVVQGNWIGVDAFGAQDPTKNTVGNGGNGVRLEGATGALIGGTAAGAGNVISNNQTSGLRLSSAASGNTVQGNLIGLAADGSTALGNLVVGVAFSQGASASAVTNNLIGTDGDGLDDALERNVISANGIGVRLAGATVTGNRVAGNLIGTDAGGTLAVGNVQYGVVTSDGATGNMIGGAAAGLGNLIAHSGEVGIVAFDEDTSNAFLGNRIVDSGLLAIDLDGDGITTNDALDTDVGPNGKLNAPVLTLATNDNGALTVTGSYAGLTSLGADPDARLLVQFFATDRLDVSGQPAARTLVGSVLVVVGADGRASGSWTLATTVPSNHWLTATATVTNATQSTWGPTSELSNAVVVDNPPPATTVPGAQTAATGAALAITGVSVTDAAGDLATVRLTVTRGTLTVDPQTVQAGGATIAAGANGSATLTLSGTEIAVNAALATLSYRSNNGYTGADTLTVIAADARAQSATDTVAITVSTPAGAPVLGSVTVSITEGATVPLSPTDIDITDSDSSAFEFTVSALTGGRFELAGAPGVAVTSFTSAQLSAGEVRFVDDGDEFAPSFALTASDGTWSSATVTADVLFSGANDAPVAIRLDVPGTTALVAGGTSASVSTLAAQPYVLSFEMSNAGAGGQAEIEIRWRGEVVATASQSSAGWQTYSVALLGSGGTDLLQLIDSQTGDDASATQVRNLRLVQADSATVSVTEGAANGTLVALAAAQDPDLGSPIELVTWQLVDDAGGLFQIDGTSGRITVADGSRLVHQSGGPNTVDVVVRATDAAGLASPDRTLTIQVLDINSAPTVTPVRTGFVYDAGDGAVLIDDQITLSDDGGTLTRVTITIGAYASGQDTLAVGNAGTLTQAWNATTGVLTLSATGGASIADFQAALRTVTYANSSATPSVVPRVLTIEADDGSLAQSATVTVTVQSVNVAPTVAPSRTGFGFDAGSSAIAVDPLITLADDGGTLTQVTVTIGSYRSGEDALAVGNAGTLTQNWNATTGVLTLSAAGGASVAEFQTALRTVTYANSSATPNVTSRVLTIAADDGALTHSATVTIAVNAAPAATPARTGFGYDAGSGAVAIDPLVTLSDANGTLTSVTVTIGSYVSGQDTLAVGNAGTLTQDWNATTGVLTLSAAGGASVTDFEAALRTVTYANSSATPNVTSRVLTIAVDDGTLQRSATVTIAVNAAPTVTPARTSFGYDAGSGAVAIDPLVTLSDANGTLTRVTVTLGAYASGEDTLAVGNAGTLNQDWNATTGVLTLSAAGGASIADFQAALRTVTYANSSATPNIASRVLTIAADDGALTHSATVTIAVNAAPTVTPARTTFGYDAGSGAVAIDPLVTLTDANGTLTRVTVTIGSYASGQDTLAVGNPGTLTQDWNATTGVLTLSAAGGASVTDFEAALRTVTYANSSATPNVTSRVLTIAVDDGTLQRSATVTVAVNAAPAVTPARTSFGYDAGSGAVAIDPLVTLSDANGTLTRVTVTVGSYVSGQDTLAVGNAGTLTQSWNATTGVLTLSAAGGAGIADFQAALRTVTYANSSATPNIASRVLTIEADDGTLQRSATVSIAVNAAPAVTPARTTFGYDAGSGAVAIDPLVTLTDANGTLTRVTVTIGSYVSGQDTLAVGNAGTLTQDWNATTGVLTLSAAGGASVADFEAALRTVTYANSSATPNVTSRVLTIAADDGSLSRSATLTVTVNAAPTVTPSWTGFGYDSGSPAVMIDPWVALSDANGTLTQVTITIGSYVSGEDTLSVGNPGTLTQDWNATTGVLTLSAAGGASVADFQAALRTVSYGNSSATPTITPRVLTIEVDDGSLTRAATMTVSMNNAPTVTPSRSSFGVDAGGGAVAIDPLVTLTDAAGTLTRVTITIGAYASGQDTLAVGDAGTLTQDWNATTGVLTLSATGGASVADFQAALRTVTYANSSATPSVVPRMLTIEADDGTMTQSATLTVTVNAAPTVAPSRIGVRYDTGSPAVAVDPLVTLSDANGTLTQVTVTIGAYVSGEDTLAVGNAGMLTQSWNATTGVLTLSAAGGAGVADFQAALRTVTYVNSSATPTLAPRELTIEADDGSLTHAATVTLAVNVAPTVTPARTTFQYTEGSGAVAIDTQVALADGNGMLTRVTVTVGSYVSDEDTLAVGNSGTLTQDWNATTGVLTLSAAGGASVADFEAALRTVTYANSSAAPNTTSRVLTIEADDGSMMRSATVTVTVESVNTGPTVTPARTDLGYDAGSGAVAIDPLVTLTDDSRTLTQVTVTIGAYASGEDTLAVGSAGTLTQSWNATTGVLTLSAAGGASVADFQAALRTVTYANSSATPDITSRVLTIEADDGVLKQSATLTIAVNAAPAVTPSWTGFRYDVGSGAVAIDPMVTLTDANGTLTRVTVTVGSYVSGQDTLAVGNAGTLTQAWNSTTGVLTLSAAGGASVADFEAALRTVTYANSSATPNIASRVLTIAVDDGTLQRSATVTVAVNVAPTVTPARTTFEYTEGSNAVAIDPLVTLSDANGTLTSVTVTIGSYVSGQDTLAVGNAGTLTQSWNATTGVLTLSATGGASVADFQAALQTVTYSNASRAPDTTARLISIVASDGTLSTTATVSITIRAVNDPLVVNISGAPNASFREGFAPVIVDPGITVEDPDATLLPRAIVTIAQGYDSGRDVLDWTPVSGISASWQSSTGQLTLTAAGPGATAAAFTAALQGVSFRTDTQAPSTTLRRIDFQVFQFDDSSLEASPVVQRFVEVTPDPDPPTLTFGSVTGLTYREDASPIVLDPWALAEDVDSPNFSGGKLVVSIVANGSANDRLGIGAIGMVGVSSNALLYNGVQVGTISGGEAGAPLEVTFQTGATSAIVTDVLRALQFQVDGQAPTTSTRTLEISLTDGESTDAAVRTVEVAIEAVNDPTTVRSNGGVSVLQGNTTVLTASNIEFYDPDTPDAQVTIVLWTAPTAGVITVDGTPVPELGSFTLEHLKQGRVRYEQTALGTTSDAFALRADDGSLAPVTASIAVRIGIINNAPQVNAPAVVQAIEDRPVIFAASGSAQRITILDDADANATVDLTLSVNGNARLTLASSAGLVVLSPSTSAAPVIAVRGTIAAINNALNELRLDPAPDFNGPLTLTVWVDDRQTTSEGGAQQTSFDVTIVVAAVDDPPTIAAPATQSVTEDTPLVFGAAQGNRIVLADVDTAGTMRLTLRVDGGTLALASTQGLTLRTGGGVADGTVVVEGTRVALQAALDGLRWTPPADRSGRFALESVIEDGSGGIAQARTVLNVAAVDDGPMLSPPPATPAAVPAGGTLALGAGLVVTDVDGSTAAVTVDLRVPVGRLWVGTTTGLTVVQTGDGAAGGTQLRLQGALDLVNASLATLQYQPPAGWSGDTAVRVAIWQATSSAPVVQSLTVRVVAKDTGSAPGGGSGTGETVAPVRTTTTPVASPVVDARPVSADLAADAPTASTVALKGMLPSMISPSVRGRVAGVVEVVDARPVGRTGLDAVTQRTQIDVARDALDRLDPSAAAAGDAAAGAIKRADRGAVDGFALMSVSADAITVAFAGAGGTAAQAVDGSDVMIDAAPLDRETGPGEATGPLLTLREGAGLAGVALTAGVVWWAIYGGTTVWLLIATGPIARTFDPLPVLIRDDGQLPVDEADAMFDEDGDGADLDGDPSLMPGARPRGPGRPPVADWMPA